MSRGVPSWMPGSLHLKMCRSSRVQRKTSRPCIPSKHATFWPGKLRSAGWKNSSRLRRRVKVRSLHLRLIWASTSSLATSSVTKNWSTCCSTPVRPSASTVWSKKFAHNRMPKTRPIVFHIVLSFSSATPLMWLQLLVLVSSETMTSFARPSLRSTNRSPIPASSHPMREQCWPSFAVNLRLSWLPRTMSSRCARWSQWSIKHCACSWRLWKVLSMLATWSAVKIASSPSMLRSLKLSLKALTSLSDHIRRLSTSTYSRLPSPWLPKDPRKSAICIKTNSSIIKYDS